MPIVINDFSLLFPPLSPRLGRRYGWGSAGVGDVAIYSQGWLFEPRKHVFGNASIGAGIKIPTGNWDLKADIPDETGNNIIRRAIYPNVMQPGDGGVGVIVGFEAFKIFRKPGFLRWLTFFASGTYLVNPRNTNGTQSIIAGLGVPLTPNFRDRVTNSVADSYAVQVGVGYRPPMLSDQPLLKGVRLRAVGRCEGVNSHDLFGENDGFRQPGYAMSIGPGITYSYGRHTILVDVPVVFNRHINPGATILPGLPARGGRPGALNFNRQMGLVAPASIQVRYVHSI